MYVAEFLNKYEGRDIVFSRVDSLEKIKESKKEAAERGIEFAIGGQQDNRYLVMYLQEDYKALAELGITDGTKLPSPLLNSVDIKEVKRMVEQERKARDTEREKQKEKQYGR